MTVKIFVTSMDSHSIKRLRVNEKQIIPTELEEDAVAIQMQELFTSITDTITTSLEVESQLTIEISGSIGLKVEGGSKYLFFNISGKAEATGGMKVILTTTIRPKVDHSRSKADKS